MTDSSQYLCLVLEGAEYLLPGSASVAIEQRHALVPENGTGAIVAWRQGRQGRWPAYGLGASMQPQRSTTWQRAVFLNGGSQPVGLVADEVHLLGRTDIHITPFTPLGAPPTRAGHFFNGAWVTADKVTFVLDPRSVVELLRSLGGVQ